MNLPHTPDSLDLLCAQASQDAYTLAGTGEPGVALQQVIQSASAHCIIRKTGNGAIIIAFRGTANICDWLTDAEVHKVMIDTGAGKCHEGIEKAWSSISAQVMSAISSNTNTSVLITGHSLGGGIAVRCARSFALNKIPFQRLVTFGQMRVFDSAGASLCEILFGDRHFRFTNAADIVPWIPWLLGTYVHSGNELYFPPLGGTGNLPVSVGNLPAQCISNPSTLLKLWDNGPELYRAWRDKEFAPIGDHFISQYIQRLRSIIPATPIIAGGVA